MVPTPLNLRSRNSGLLYSVASLVVHNVPNLVRKLFADGQVDNPTTVTVHTFAKREEQHDAEFIVFACLIPVLVLLSGLFAGLTLGYMSLDETQLHVLSISGTPKQKAYAKKIEPIRKNGHLLLVTLLLANMIVNETLPVISTKPLGGGVPSVVVSTVLIVIFSEIIPQSVCTRHGLAIGANMVWLVRILIVLLGVVAWPVAKLLEFILGPHHGIMYRRAELKELIAMHATTGELGGDLKHDTINIIGATLDLQEKVVKQAMTPIDKVFMLKIDCKLDYETMKRIADTGHSRVPVYEEIEVPLVDHDPTESGTSTSDTKDLPLKTQRVKKIVGILLVKQCLTLDPKEEIPLRKLTLNRVITVPNNMSLLAILDRFQEGRSHMAVVSRFSEEKAASVKQVVKKGLTQRLMARVGINDSSGSDTESDSDSEHETDTDAQSTVDGGSLKSRNWKKRFRRKRKAEADVERAEPGAETTEDNTIEMDEMKQQNRELALSQSAWAKLLTSGREQKLPDDAVLTKEDAKDFLQSFDPAVAPLGIITLEDVLEELIGEEIYDEFDPEGPSNLKSFTSTRQRLNRGRPAEPSAAYSPEAPSETVTAVSLEESGSQQKSHSVPGSPVLGPHVTITESKPISRTASLGQSLSALAHYRRARGPSSGTSTPRGRSRARHTSMPPAVGSKEDRALTERVSDVREEEDVLSIPRAQEKSGPDIGDNDQEENKEWE